MVAGKINRRAMVIGGVHNSEPAGVQAVLALLERCIGESSVGEGRRRAIRASRDAG